MNELKDVSWLIWATRKVFFLSVKPNWFVYYKINKCILFIFDRPGQYATKIQINTVSKHNFRIYLKNYLIFFSIQKIFNCIHTNLNTLLFLFLILPDHRLEISQLYNFRILWVLLQRFHWCLKGRVKLLSHDIFFAIVCQLYQLLGILYFWLNFTFLDLD